MAKKIKLSELSIKSSVVELNKQERKAAKGGFYISPQEGRDKLMTSKTGIADTMVDIRFHSGKSEQGRP